MKKRVLSFVLAMAMLCSMAPVSAFAAEGPAVTPESADTQEVSEPAPAVEPGDESADTGEVTDPAVDPDGQNETSPEEEPANETAADSEGIADDEVTVDDEVTADGEVIAGDEATVDGEVIAGDEATVDGEVIADDEVTVDGEAAGDGDTISTFAKQGPAFALTSAGLQGRATSNIRLWYQESGVRAMLNPTDEVKSGKYNLWFKLPDGAKMEETTLTITKPDGTPVKDIPPLTYANDEKTYVVSTGCHLDMPGKYTVTIAYTVPGEGDGVSVPKEETQVLELIAVEFKTGDNGRFVNDDDGDGDDKTHTSYYQKPANPYDGYLLHSSAIPQVQSTIPGSDFIGWAATPGITEYKDLLDEARAVYDIQTCVIDNKDVQRAADGNGGMIYTVHAAYGQKKTTAFKVTDEDGSEINNANAFELYDSKAFPYGIAAGYDPETYRKTVLLKNTGTEDITIFPQAVPGFAEVKYLKNGSEDVSNEKDFTLKKNEQCNLVITPNGGLAPGEYSGSLRFRVNEKSMNYILTVTFKVTRNELTVTILGNQTKAYGQTLTAGDIPTDNIEVKTDSGFTYPGMQAVQLLERLGVTLYSAGFAPDAAVNDDGYPYTIDTTSVVSGYTVTIAENSKVVRVTPSEPKMSSLTATSVHTGNALWNSRLSGTFHNRYDAENLPAVTGDLKWVEPDTNVGDQVGRRSFDWKFTPTGADAKNYKEITGTVEVEISYKPATTLYRLPEYTLSAEYDGSAHKLEYSSDRADDDTPIKVEYRPAGSDESAWSETNLPLNAGTYQVRATIAEGVHYAPATLIETFTITPKPVTVIFDGINPWIYTGTTAVPDGSVKAHLRDILPRDLGKGMTLEFTAELASPNAAAKAAVNITLKALHSSDNDVTAGNYKLPYDAVDKYTTIHPASLTIDAPEFTKEYGELFLPDASQYAIGGLKRPDTVESLGLTLISQGESADAAVQGGPYPVGATITNTNYTFSRGTNSVLYKADCGSITVKPVEPRPSLISVGSGHYGCPLSHASLTGSFVNPHNNEPVIGTITWADPEAELPDSGTSTTAKWMFTTDDPNYISPIYGDATIDLQAQDPVKIEVSGESSVPYNGKPHGLTVTVVPASVYTVRYRCKGSEDWLDGEPTEAGTYEVLIVASPTGDYAGNQLSDEFTITAVEPDIDHTKVDRITVPQGTSVNDAEVLQHFAGAFTFNGETVTGTIVWNNPDQAIDAGDLPLMWAFIPDSTNYKSVGGVTVFALTPETRTVSATAYNLPAALQYSDYAVVEIGTGDNALKPGDEITFFKDEACSDPVSKAIPVTAEDVDNTRLTIPLDGDALEPGQDGSIWVRISNHENSPITKIDYWAEPGFELVDNGGGPAESIIVHPDSFTKVTARLANEHYAVKDPDGVLFTLLNNILPSGDEIVTMATSEDADAYSRLLKGANPGDSGAILTVTVTFPHPDPDKAKAGEVITLTDTMSITCIYTFDANAESGSGVPSVSVPPAQLDALKAEAQADPTLAPKLEEAQKKGDKAEIVLSVAAAEETEYTEDKKKADDQAAAAGYEDDIAYLDINLNLIVNDKDATPIYTLSQELAITIGIPDALDVDRSSKEFAVIRVHHTDPGDTPQIDVQTDQDSDPDTITFFTDRFSLYAVVYRDAPTPPPAPTEPEHREEPANKVVNEKKDKDKVTPAAPAAPVVTIPQTSDESSPALWAALFVFSALGLGALGVYAVRRRRKMK